VDQIQAPDEKIAHSDKKKKGVVGIFAGRPGNYEDSERNYDRKEFHKSMEEQKAVKAGDKHRQRADDDDQGEKTFSV